ncbi:acetate--CoA ligase family protein [Thermoflexus sp.]|uniref:acetate--CoA ligase family protein n=1 Tax=Thermoflexus sp. TaxID=1969742 RepID=UPI0025CCE435|nr:acetate--CoA ligase family protein [Thermoflexus sp.]MDW8181030.1 acetate--CoA ligase family protein [Anaerolineae bacterium]MCS6964794.1 acetate--CoA ligase family protein [Thermoflexus sp.]MCS7351572.1 acetate--CoA ligase family protein [Thermoflexus sp.]MCX7691503.1 acetate--CoA ligase family protein [Thermoflexus sp.]MDW8185452.1 acetate--CoA ligase family protein [Anaerolineae bacterium]
MGLEYPSRAWTAFGGPRPESLLALEDVTFRLPPLTWAEARDILEETGIGRRLLRRDRTGGSAEIEAVVDILRRVGQMMLEHPEIVEIDLNIVVVARPGQEIHTVDIRIVLSEEIPASVEATAR